MKISSRDNIKIAAQSNNPYPEEHKNALESTGTYEQFWYMSDDVTQKKLLDKALAWESAHPEKKNLSPEQQREEDWKKKSPQEQAQTKQLHKNDLKNFYN